MSTKVKDTRGRKALPPSEKKVAIYVMVPLKFKEKAQKAINIAAARFR